MRVVASRSFSCSSERGRRFSLDRGEATRLEWRHRNSEREASEARLKRMRSLRDRGERGKSFNSDRGEATGREWWLQELQLLFRYRATEERRGASKAEHRAS